MIVGQAKLIINRATIYDALTRYLNAQLYTQAEIRVTYVTQNGDDFHVIIARPPATEAKPTKK